MYTEYVQSPRFNPKRREREKKEEGGGRGEERENFFMDSISLCMDYVNLPKVIFIRR